MAFLPKILNDAHDYRESVLTCLRKLEREGGILTYEDDVRVEDPERYVNKTRTQSAYRTFQEFVGVPSVLYHAQVHAYNLGGGDLPENSAWANALREGGAPTEINQDFSYKILCPRVFYPYISRVWRELAPESKRVFYAVSAIRALGVGARWVEHLWDVDHPQSEEIREETTALVDLERVEERFGPITLTGPYTARTLKRLGIRSDPGDSSFDLPGWRVPVFSQTYTFRETEKVLFLRDSYYKVFFWATMSPEYRDAILPLLTTEAPRTPPKRMNTRSRVPSAPKAERIRYSEDLLESVAARLGDTYTTRQMERVLTELQLDGFLEPTFRDIQGFVRQYEDYIRE